ncbi:MAG: two-component regulator propeller domain-containing protein [Chitinophagaceae bacterium]
MQRFHAHFTIRLLLLLAFLLITVINIKGQSYYFSHLQVENGLTNNAVVCSLQDKKGFMWFGTRDGLNRFDGLSFKNFLHDPDNAKSLGNNLIHCLYEDNDEILWVGTDRGLYRYDATTESFAVLKNTKNNSIRDIRMDQNGNLWFISGNVLYKYNTSVRRLQSFAHLRNFDATAICATANGAIWVSTSNGYLHRYNPANELFTGYPVFDKSMPASSNWIETIYDVGNGSLLVGTSNQGVKLFHTSTGSYKDILTYNPDRTEIYARDFIKHTDNEYWIATESGIYIYDLEKGNFTNLRKQYNNPYSLSDNAVYTFCKDREGGIWVGTFFGGVNYYPKQYMAFEKFFPKVAENSISGNAVREICADSSGNLWIGTEDAGLNQLQLKNKKFTHFTPIVGKPSISNTNIHGLMVLNEKLWIGTFKRGLDVMDIKTRQVIKHYYARGKLNSLNSDFIHSIISTSSGKILIGTDRGLYFYNEAVDDFMLVPNVPENIFYTNLFEDSQETIWAGTYRDGLYSFNLKSPGSRNYRNYSNDKNSLSSNRINSVFEDSNGQLWINTEGGLCTFNPDKNGFKIYDTKKGFPSNVTYAMLEDGEKNLWVSTSKGLVCLNPKTEKLKIYTKANGLLSDQFNYNSAYKDASGRMYFGSVKGLISFNPSQFSINTFIPPVYITGFQVQNKELAVQGDGSPLKKSITYTKKIVLDHKQSSFNIDFAALSFTVPEMTEYAYKMEELDKDWNHLKTYRRVYYTELPPGDYVFKVKASNSSGIWSEKETRLEIEILPPLWASPGAYLGYAVMVGLLFFYALRNYHVKTEEKNRRKIEIFEIKKEKEIYQAKLEFFTNVAHEIRTPLTLIKGPLEKVMKKAMALPDMGNHLKIMEKNTNRLIDLTNQLLDFRKIETTWFSLNFIYADISELLEENVLSFKPVAEQKNVSLAIDIPEAHVYASIDVEAMNKIFSNLVGNAVKYASANVRISLLPVSKDDKSFTVIFKNDGYLISYDLGEKIFEPFYRLKEAQRQQGSGIGLSLSRSLAELHQGVLTLEKPQNGCNTFRLTLPIRQDKTIVSKTEKNLA